MPARDENVEKSIYKMLREGNKYGEFEAEYQAMMKDDVLRNPWDTTAKVDFNFWYRVFFETY